MNNSNYNYSKTDRFESDPEIQTLNLEDLDVEELEHRLELATASKPLPCAEVCQVLVRHDWLGG